MASLSMFTCVFTVVALLIGLLATLDVFKPYTEKVTSYFSMTTTGKSLKGRVFTKTELAQYTGVDKKDIYIAILGEVFDVTRGKQHYGEGGGYHFFSGKDGTRAFVSGDFTDKGLIEDTTGLTHTDLLGLEDWKKFYNKDYKYIGKLHGHFYNENGESTAAMKDYESRLVDAHKSKLAEEDDRKIFPPCNFESKQGGARRIWCSTLSGGIQREWVGVPRQYFQTGKTEPRCACVKNVGSPSTGGTGNNGDLDNKHMKVYDGCHPSAFECRFQD